MSTKVVILLVTAMLCATALLVAGMLDDPESSPPATVDFCPAGRTC